jgi:hypothetical protein
MRSALSESVALLPSTIGASGPGLPTGATGTSGPGPSAAASPCSSPYRTLGPVQTTVTQTGAYVTRVQDEIDAATLAFVCAIPLHRKF